MSHSTIWKVYKTTVTAAYELRNGWGTAPPVWDWLCEKYLEEEKHWHLKDDKSLWKLWKNTDIPRHMRFALLVTFDSGMVEPKDLNMAHEWAGYVYEEINNFYKDARINHWELISQAYKKLSYSKDSRLLGIALGCTSVSDPWWEYPKNNKPFSVFEALAKY